MVILCKDYVMSDAPEVSMLRDLEDRYPDDIEFDNERWERLKTELNSDLGEVIYNTSFFVLGSYKDQEATRLRSVCDALEPHGYPYLMEEIEELWEFWTTKFKILVSRSDYVVGVYEHSDGGHVWEAGYIDQRKYRERTHVLKRIYATEDVEHDRFDAMFAHYLESMKRIDQFYPWGLDDAPERIDSLEGALAEFITDELPP